MRIYGTVEVDYRSRAAKEHGLRFAEDYVLDQTAVVERLAKRNVTPGRGPGPHPHRTEHEDTGQLMQSITSDVEVKGSRVVGIVGTNVIYGMFLEVGWHSRSGNFYRYPWLAPAMHEAKRYGPTIAQRHSHVWFEGDLTEGRQKVAAGWIPPGIRWDPGVRRFRGPNGRFISRDTFELMLAAYHARAGG